MLNKKINFTYGRRNLHSSPWNLKLSFSEFSTLYGIYGDEVDAG